MCFIYSLGVSLCNRSFPHIYVSFSSMSTQGHFSCFLSAVLFGIYHSLSLVSFLPVFTFFLKTNAVCRPLKICNITVRVFATQPRQEPQSEEGIKLSEDFPSHIMLTFEQDSPQLMYVVGLLVDSTLRDFCIFFLVGGLARERQVIEGKCRLLFEFLCG